MMKILIHLKKIHHLKNNRCDSFNRRWVVGVLMLFFVQFTLIPIFVWGDEVADEVEELEEDILDIQDMVNSDKIQEAMKKILLIPVYRKTSEKVEKLEDKIDDLKSQNQDLKSELRDCKAKNKSE